MKEKQKGLHIIFIDLEEAYDEVPRHEVRRCMRKNGAPEKNVRLVQEMYERAGTQYISILGFVEWIQVRVGLDQGSALRLKSLKFDKISNKELIL